MTQNILKQKVAEAALEHVKGVRVLGVGTGSTVNYMIDMLSDFKSQIDAAVSSSEGSTIRLKKAGIHVIDLNEADELELYVDGADEINAQLQMVKGGGGALTREKIIGAASRRFLCIADETKYVDVLGKFPLPVEVIPMARSFVAREMVKMGGQPVWREGFVSDNHCHILDVHNLEILNPTEMENVINDIPGVVTCGIFALRAADAALLGSLDGIRTLS